MCFIFFDHPIGCFFGVNCSMFNQCILRSPTASQEEKKKDDIKKITEAYFKSKRALDEVLNFQKGKADM